MSTHKLWKSWKITKKSSMHGKIMESEKPLNNHGKNIMPFIPLDPILSTHNICFGQEIRKLIFDYALLARGLNIYGIIHQNEKCSNIPSTHGFSSATWVTLFSSFAGLDFCKSQVVLATSSAAFLLLCVFSFFTICSDSFGSHSGRECNLLQQVKLILDSV